MDALFDAIQQSAPAAALRGSFVVYPVVNALHILAIGALVTSVGLMDLRVLGAFRALPEVAFVSAMRRVAFGALAVAVATGLMLFSVRATEYGTMPLFWIKLGLIGVAVANAVAFGLVRDTGMKRGLAVLSIGLWLAAVLAGRFLGFVG